jgi:hypothetical protein
MISADGRRHVGRRGEDRDFFTVKDRLLRPGWRAASVVKMGASDG